MVVVVVVEDSGYHLYPGSSAPSFVSPYTLIFSEDCNFHIYIQYAMCIYHWHWRRLQNSASKSLILHFCRVYRQLLDFKLICYELNLNNRKSCRLMFATWFFWILKSLRVCCLVILSQSSEKRSIFAVNLPLIIDQNINKSCVSMYKHKGSSSSSFSL